MRTYELRAFFWQDGKMIDLGIEGAASAINNRGQVVGWSNGTDGAHGFIWRKGKLTDLGAFGAADAYANDISESGTVVGAGWKDDCCRSRAIFWER